MNADEKYMMRCIQLAQGGKGHVAPNPLVGAVVVHQDLIIGEGFHRAFGGAHAEVHALDAVSDPELLKESTLYVNLEPCSHHGKTPPCALRVIEMGIKRVVVGQQDPNPLVAGRGIDLMRQAGIDVQTGVLENESRHLNRRFNTFHTAQRPYVLLKWAQTADGFMDMHRQGESGAGVHWISAPATRKLVHQWRSEEMAIMVGANTVRNDDPSLTVRDIDGTSPLRVVIAPSGELPKGSKILTDGHATVIVNEVRSETVGQVSWLKATRGDFIDAALEHLYNLKVGSVMVEGGAHLLQAFIDKGCWDEAKVIHAPLTLGTGLLAPTMNVKAAHSFAFGADRIYQYFAG